MNELSNGAILPSGLLSGYSVGEMAGFDKTYRNYGLRVGIITKMFPKNDPQNISKLVPEYEVMVFEQNEDKGLTPIVYRNCISSQGFGSKADFLEFNYRKLEKKTSKGTTPSMAGQNGPAVLLQCLDSMSEKAIIVSGFPHPDRPTTLVDEEPHLEGEYNGVRISVNSDGSTQLIFKSATDNDGQLLNKDQTPTTIDILSDGSFQISHSMATFKMDAVTGDVTVTSQGSINLTAGKDAVVTATGNTVLNCVDLTATATGNISATCVKADIVASGDATIEGKSIKLGKSASESVVKGDAFKTYFSTHTHPTAVGPSGPAIQPFTPNLLSKKVKTE